MTTLLEELRGRLEAATKRLGVATQRFQAAQQELQVAQAECSVWTSAVNIETREENARAALVAANQIPMDLAIEGTATPVALAASGACLDLQPDATASPESTNKTELVRELLRQHAGGMTPADLWKSAEGQISSRAYLYSILKRLRDRDEVTLRRKKYALKFKPLETKSDNETVTVQ